MHHGADLGLGQGEFGDQGGRCLRLRDVVGQTQPDEYAGHPVMRVDRHATERLNTRLVDGATFAQAIGEPCRCQSPGVKREFDHPTSPLCAVVNDNVAHSEQKVNPNPSE